MHFWTKVQWNANFTVQQEGKLWHSYGEDCFTKETDKLVYNFNASISFDQKFYKQDIQGSMAHVKMLAKQGILTEDEKEQILKGLEGILAE